VEETIGDLEINEFRGFPVDHQGIHIFENLIQIPRLRSIENLGHCFCLKQFQGSVIAFGKSFQNIMLNQGNVLHHGPTGDFILQLYRNVFFDVFVLQPSGAHQPECVDLRTNFFKTFLVFPYQFFSLLKYLEFA
jgi:hypothetical protein